MFAHITLQKIGVAAMAWLALAALAQADAFSDHLKTDPSAIDRPMTNRMAEPEYTGSLKSTTPAPQLTKKCSYDSYYWGTIYACDPTRNPADPVFIEQERRGGNQDNSNAY